MRKPKSIRKRITDEEILKPLSAAPATLSKLAERLNKPVSSLQRPLNKLLERGLITKSENKEYYIPYYY